MAGEDPDDEGFEREEVIGPLADPKIAPREESTTGRDPFAPVGSGQPVPPGASPEEPESSGFALPSPAALPAPALTGILLGLAAAVVTWLVRARRRARRSARC
jgi:hypothetical protein